MKILHVIPAYYPATRYGGPVRSVHELCKSMVKKGHSITVFTTNFDGFEAIDVQTNKPHDIDGVKVYYFKVNSPFSYFRSIDLKKKLYNSIKKFDLVHLHTSYSYPTFIAARYAQKFKVPYLISPRGMLDKGAIELKGALKKKLYLFLFEKKIFLNAELIHYTSADEKKKSFYSNLNKQIEVIPNGIDVQKLKSQNASAWPEKFKRFENKNVVLFLGRINYIKGLDILVEAWKKVIAVNPNSFLVIAGPDNDGYKPKIELLIKKLKISDSVIFTGELDFKNKVNFLKKSRILVAPSYLESFGMSIVEAMACGKPVVVTDKVNISPIIKRYDSGLITPSCSNDFGSAIISLLGNKKDIEIKGLNGARLVNENFSLESVSKKMITVYKKLILKYR